jgi:hypothetical protein
VVDGEHRQCGVDGDGGQRQGLGHHLHGRGCAVRPLIDHHPARLVGEHRLRRFVRARAGAHGHDAVDVAERVPDRHRDARIGLAGPPVRAAGGFRAAPPCDLIRAVLPVEHVEVLGPVDLGDAGQLAPVQYSERDSGWR